MVFISEEYCDIMSIFSCIPIAEDLLSKGARLGVVLFYDGRYHVITAIHDHA